MIHSSKFLLFIKKKKQNKDLIILSFYNQRTGKRGTLMFTRNFLLSIQNTNYLDFQIVQLYKYIYLLISVQAPPGMNWCPPPDARVPSDVPPPEETLKCSSDPSSTLSERLLCSLMKDILIGHITVDLVLILSQEFCFIS